MTSVGVSSSAAISGPLSAVQDPSQAIAQGSSVFSKAWSLGDNGNDLIKVCGTAQAICAGLGSGALSELATALGGAVSGAGLATAIGAALGSAIGPEGTAAGAVIGAMVSLFSSIFGGGEVQKTYPDERTQAEQFCFPAFDPSNPYAQPYCWPEVRLKTNGYMTPSDSSPFWSGTPFPIPASFTVGWHSPSESWSTAGTQEAAWIVAQAFLSQDDVSTLYAQGGFSPGNNLTIANEMSQIAEQAREYKSIPGFENDTQLKDALDRLGSWYGTRFVNGQYPIYSSGQKYNTSTGDVVYPNPSSNNSDDAVAASAKQFAKMAKVVNAANAQDWIYYYSPAWATHQESGTNELCPAILVSADLAIGAQVAWLACPDTCLVGLAEIAVAVELRLIEPEDADTYALHYMMGLAWLWRSARKNDALRTIGAEYYPGEDIDHPNFLRVIGIISRKIGKMKAAPTVSTASRSSIIAAEMRGDTHVHVSSAAGAELARGFAVTHPASSPTVYLLAGAGALAAWYFLF
jgi:hypothetical protein